MSSEDGKKCWRCGFKIPNGSICLACGTVNDLKLQQSAKKTLPDEDLGDDDKQKIFLNAKPARDNEIEELSQPNAMSGSIIGRVEEKMEGKYIGILSTDSQVLTALSKASGESRDRCVDLQSSLVVMPDQNDVMAATVTTPQEKVE